ncbi:hypothetical protein GJAV_G00142700 [Gymnothorax javanicus]|nr:hypothetical protein GJAV_G00142700 [Gymnothorax javanicus]
MASIVKGNIAKKAGEDKKYQNMHLLLAKRSSENIRSEQRKGGKLERSWLGLYKILRLEEKSADLLDEQVLLPKINTDHLKAYQEPTRRIPHRMLEKPPSKKANGDVTSKFHSCSTITAKFAT